MTKDLLTVTIIAMALIVLPSYFAPREYLTETIRRMEFPAYFGLELDILKLLVQYWFSFL